jgi:hypothetical protein
MQPSWITDAREQLLRLRTAGRGWSYRPGGEPSIEPTAWAGLALRAAGIEPDLSAIDAELEAADWVARMQQADGALGPSENLRAPHWPTGPALLCWGTRDRFLDQRRKAVHWLLTHEGDVQTSSNSPFGHDASIPGWPWVAGTHSWLEPTAHAVLALRQQGQRDHKRVRDGIRMIRDRSVRTGGWNYGNSSVFGTDLRAQPAPTGLALLALHGTTAPDDPMVVRAGDYLEKTLPITRSAQSLCWGLLALTAWNRRPAVGDDRLSAAFAVVGRRSDLPIQLAYLLLASTPQSLTLFS